MSPGSRPRCQVQACLKLCTRKHRNADGTVEYRSRCVMHHRRKTPTMPVGVRQIQGICGPFSDAGKQLEAIAPVLTTEPATPDPQPGDSICLNLPLPERLVTQITLEDAEVEGVVLALRLRGVSQRRIGDLLGKDSRTIQRILRNARADHKLNDVLTDLSYQALPLAVERLLEHLDDGAEWAIKETVRGLGAFRTYRQQDIHRDSEDTRTLHIKFETPDRPVILNAENIVGVPRRLTKGVVDVPVPQRSPEEILPQPGSQTGRDFQEDRGGMGCRLEGATSSRESHSDNDPLVSCLERP